MFYKLKDKLNRLKFSTVCQGIYDTNPIVAATDRPIAVLTLLQHKDVLLFLIAIKSFTRKVDINKVIIINDGSLTQRDFRVILKHIPIAEIRDARDFSTENCPTGGCWERLLAIAHYTTNYYVIQLDADTLTLNDIPEVQHLINSETAFTIGTWDNQTIEPMLLCSQRVRKNVVLTAESHVQMLAEACLQDIENVEHLNYVRGCAGFTGFPRNAISTQFIVDISKKIEQIIGEKWRQWGSEQVMSNIVIANCKPSAVLPHPKYCDCTQVKPETAFIHFIGECRFKTKQYQMLAKEIINNL